MSKSLTKTLSLVLALVMCLSLMSVGVWATDGENEIHVATAEELRAAEPIATGKTVIMDADITLEAIEHSGYDYPGNKQGIIITGGTLNGNGHKLSLTGSGDTKTIVTTGGTIQNLTIDSGFRGISIWVPTTDVVLDNVTLDTDCYGLNTAETGNAEVELIVTNSTLKGWSSYSGNYSSIVFADCSFSRDTDGYGYSFVRPYCDTTFTNCQFSADSEIGDNAANLTYTFEGCKKDGSDLTKSTILGSGLIGNDNCTESLTIIVDDDKYSFATQEWTAMVATTDDEGNTVYVDAAAKIENTRYPTLADAIAAADSGDTVTLLENVSLDSIVTIDNGQSLTLDLNGKKLDGQYVDLYNGFLSVTDTAETKGSFDNLVYVNVGQDEAQAAGEYNRFTLDSTAVMNNNVYVYQNNTPKGYGSQVDISGTMNGLIFVLGNIHEGNSVVDVSGTISSPDDVAIALNGYATVNVSDGAVISANKDGKGTAIEVRAGTLNVTGGTMTGYGEPTSVTANGSGTTSTGAGIAVSQHTTKLPIAVNITGGTINGYSAFYESNPQKNSAEDLAKITLNIAGGTFNATQGGTAAVYSEDVTGFISGGTFSSNPNAYVKEGYAVVRNSDGTFTVQMAENTVSEITVAEGGLTTKSEDEVTPEEVTAAVDAVKEELANTAVTSTIDEVPADVATGIDVTMKEIVVGKETAEEEAPAKTVVKSITFDVTPFKTTGETKVDVHDLGQEITVVLPLPVNFDFGGDIRVIHDGKEVVKTGTLNPTARTYTFKARFFSTYEITTRSQDYTVSVEQVNGKELNAKKINSNVDKFYHSGETVYEALIINNKTDKPLQGLSYELTYDSRYFDLSLNDAIMNTEYDVSIKPNPVATQAATDGTVTLTVETLSTTNIPNGEIVLAVLPFKVKDTFGLDNDTHNPAPADDGVRYVSISADNSIVSSGLSTEVAPSLKNDKITIKNFYKLILENPTLVTGDKGLTYPTSAVNGSNTAYIDSGAGPWYVKYDRASGANLVIENAGVGTYKYDYRVSFAGLKDGTTASATDGENKTNSTVTIPWADVKDDITVTLTATPNEYDVVVANDGEPLTIAEDKATYGTNYSFTINDFDDALYDYKYTVTVGEKTIVNEVNADTALRTIDGSIIKGAVTGKNLTIKVTKTYDVKVAWKIDYVTGWTLVLVGAKHPTGFAYQYAAATDPELAKQSPFYLDQRYTKASNIDALQGDALSTFDGYDNIYAVLIDSSARNFTLTRQDVLDNLKVTRATTEAATAYDSGNTIEVNVDINNNGITNYGDILAMYRAYQKYIREVGEDKTATNENNGNLYNEFVYKYMDYYLRADANNNGKLDTQVDLQLVRDGTADPYSISGTTNP